MSVMSQRLVSDSVVSQLWGLLTHLSVMYSGILSSVLQLTSWLSLGIVECPLCVCVTCRMRLHIAGVG